MGVASAGPAENGAQRSPKALEKPGLPCSCHFIPFPFCRASAPAPARHTHLCFPYLGEEGHMPGAEKGGKASRAGKETGRKRVVWCVCWCVKIAKTSPAWMGSLGCKPGRRGQEIKTQVKKIDNRNITEKGNSTSWAYIPVFFFLVVAESITMQSGGERRLS